MHVSEREGVREGKEGGRGGGMEGERAQVV